MNIARQVINYSAYIETFGKYNLENNITVVNAFFKKIKSFKFLFALYECKKIVCALIMN